MTVLSIGQRAPLNKLAIEESLPISIKFSLSSLIEMDISCFALDQETKLISDDYMIFYNQPNSPCKQINLTNYQATHSPTENLQADFNIHLTNLPSTVDSLYFVLSADNSLNKINSLSVEVSQKTLKAQASYQPSDFADNQASMLISVYRKNGVWRIANVAQGFKGGLASMVMHFGGNLEDDTTNAVNQSTDLPKVSLEKEMLEKAPELVNLAKKASVSLEKRQLQNLTSKVALVLDASGSMSRQYLDGRVQEIVNRLLPLAVSFDDDKSLDCWAFGKKPLYLSEISLDNYKNYINTVQRGWTNWRVGARLNNEADTIKMVIDFYKQEKMDLPVYVLFISDGGVSNNRAISNLITKAAELPIFWQFVGIGGSNYGILEHLDDMQGRLVDNCNFFALDDLHDVSEEELYERLLEEFPGWLQEIKRIGMI